MEITRLGPYEIEKPLGKGGMGSVFAAIDSRTGAKVAIKALTPHLALAEGFRERFESEIESLKTLRHEGIVRLFGYGEENGVLFYSMELVDGTSLEDELKAGRRFNWREVTSIAIQLALALKHAHDHGVIHRDIKPANVLLYGDDRVKLADFGIARLFGSSQLTTAGGVLGTADYMSPEQADGRPVSNRCDQYSLGGVMYALLTGRPPFRAKNLPQMLQLQRFAEPEPVRRFAPDTPEQLERVVLQLLAKDPAMRFPNMQVLARHLQAMYMALTRPAADGFALSSDDLPIAPSGPLDQSLQTSRTKDDPLGNAPARTGVDQQTLDSSESPSAASPVRPDEATLAAKEIKDSDHQRQEGSPPRPSLTERTPTVTAAASPVRPTRFTTIEEEEQQRRGDAERSWITVAGQLAVLLAVLSGMVGLGFYLARPATADDLYDRIIAAADEDGGESLFQVESQINEFLRRFPNDPRSGEVRQFEDQLQIELGERRLLAAARRGRSASRALLPAEQLYLDAVETSQHSLAGAIHRLESLVALYSPVPGGDGAGTPERNAEWRQREKVAAALAERRLLKLREELRDRTSAQLVSLAERMEAAAALADDDPQRAKAMFHAVIELHQGDPWAAAIVAEARHELAKLQQQNDKQ